MHALEALVGTQILFVFTVNFLLSLSKNSLDPQIFYGGRRLSGINAPNCKALFFGFHIDIEDVVQVHIQVGDSLLQGDE